MFFSLTNYTINRFLFYRFDPRWAEYWNMYREWCDRYGDRGPDRYPPLPPMDQRPPWARSRSRSPVRHRNAPPNRSREPPRDRPRSPGRSGPYLRDKSGPKDDPRGRRHKDSREDVGKDGHRESHRNSQKDKREEKDPDISKDVKSKDKERDRMLLKEKRRQELKEKQKELKREKEKLRRIKEQSALVLEQKKLKLKRVKKTATDKAPPKKVLKAKVGTVIQGKEGTPPSQIQKISMKRSGSVQTTTGSYQSDIRETSSAVSGSDRMRHLVLIKRDDNIPKNEDTEYTSHTEDGEMSSVTQSPKEDEYIIKDKALLDAAEFPSVKNETREIVDERELSVNTNRKPKRKESMRETDMLTDDDTLQPHEKKAKVQPALADSSTVDTMDTQFTSIDSEVTAIVSSSDQDTILMKSVDKIESETKKTEADTSDSQTDTDLKKKLIEEQLVAVRSESSEKDSTDKKSPAKKRKARTASKVVKKTSGKSVKQGVVTNVPELSKWERDDSLSEEEFLPPRKKEEKKSLPRQYYFTN